MGLISSALVKGHLFLFSFILYIKIVRFYVVFTRLPSYAFVRSFFHFAMLLYIFACLISFPYILRSRSVITSLSLIVTGTEAVKCCPVKEQQLDLG